MGIWVRNQNRNFLLEVDTFEVQDNWEFTSDDITENAILTTIQGEEYLLGGYSTISEAFAVLDALEEHIRCEKREVFIMPEKGFTNNILSDKNDEPSLEYPSTDLIGGIT
jgi:hypothetical protein